MTGYRRFLAGALTLLVTINVHATSQCDGEDCINEARAERIGAVDAGLLRCAESEPARASEYLERRRRFLAKADQPPGFLAVLQASRSYPAARLRMNAASEGADKKLLSQMCASLLADPGPTSVADDNAYVEVGEVPLICPITIETTVNFRMPSNWRVSPRQAVELATTRAETKCNSKFAQTVFADDKNYYIVKPLFNSMSALAHAVVVNGVTGEVSTRN